MKQEDNDFVKIQRENFIKEIIPNNELSLELKQELLADFKASNKAILTDRKTFVGHITSFLDKTIVEI